MVCGRGSEHAVRHLTLADLSLLLQGIVALNADSECIEHNQALQKALLRSAVELGRLRESIPLAGEGGAKSPAERQQEEVTRVRGGTGDRRGAS